MKIPMPEEARVAVEEAVTRLSHIEELLMEIRDLLKEQRDG